MSGRKAVCVIGKVIIHIARSQISTKNAVFLLETVSPLNSGEMFIGKILALIAGLMGLIARTRGLCLRAKTLTKGKFNISNGISRSLVLLHISCVREYANS